MSELEAIDPSRCQCEKLAGSFMTFGPRSLVRCPNPPKWVGFDIREGKFYGAMSLCEECRKICQVQVPTAVYQPLLTAIGETRAQTIAILEEAYRKHAKANWSIAYNLNLPKWVRDALDIPKVKPHTYK